MNKLNEYQSYLDNIEQFRNIEVRRRKVDYIKRGNKGRPRRTDFITLKVKDLIDYDLMERFELGFETHYINE